MSVERWIGLGALLGLVGLVGCGPLADTTYYGEVLFQIEGTVQADELNVDFEGDVGVALLWSNESGFDLTAQSVLVETRFPTRYTLKIFRPPGEDTALEMPGQEALLASVGQILLYEDIDSDGVWNQEEEELIGGAYNAAVLFVPDGAVPYAEQAVGDPMSPSDVDGFVPEFIPDTGFHLVEVAPGPACELAWEYWMAPADASRATLYVGYYDVGLDWDCDAEDDWGEWFGAQAPDGSLWFDDECPPPDILESDCSFLEEMLLEQASGDPTFEFDDFLEGWLWMTEDPCYEAVCPIPLEELAARGSSPL